MWLYCCFNLLKCVVLVNLSGVSKIFIRRENLTKVQYIYRNHCLVFKECSYVLPSLWNPNMAVCVSDISIYDLTSKENN